VTLTAKSITISAGSSVACVWYKSKQCDICRGILKVKIDHKLHVINYSLMVQGHPTVVHVVADMHKSDAEQLSMCNRQNINNVRSEYL
jgi:hypothetical protein